MLYHPVLLTPNLPNAIIVLVMADSSRERVAARSGRAHLARRAGQVADLTSQPRHEGVLLRTVFLFFQIGCKLVLRFFFPLAQSVFKELLRSPLLHGLLFKNVLQEVFVPLNQPL